MKQIIQNLKTGETELVDIPSPHQKHGHNLIQTSTSLISAGTERMLVDFVIYHPNLVRLSFCHKNTQNTQS